MPHELAFLLPALLGSIVGAVIALSGAGGGIIAVPLLVLGLHLPLAEAAPIGLIAVALAAGTGAVLAWRAGQLRYRAALFIGGCGLLAAPLGVALAHRLPNQPLLLAFALLMLWTGWRGLRPAATPQLSDSAPAKTCRLDPADGRFIWNRTCTRALAGIGLVSGLFSGLLGVGGGFVIVPALRRHSELTPQAIIGTSMGIMTLIALGSIAAAAGHGAIDLRLAGGFAGGALIGLIGGRSAARTLDEGRLQRVFAVLCLIAGLSLAGRAAGILP